VIALHTNAAFQYNGRVFDQGTGFHDYGARSYWPQIGRFISPDTAGPNLSNPASLNRYSYVWNNPYKYVDPDGHNPVVLMNFANRAVQWCQSGGCQAAGNAALAAAGAVAAWAGIEIAMHEAKEAGKDTAAPDSTAKPTEKPRFVAQPDGQLVDTDATPQGSYDQPSGGRTDVLQKEDHGSGQSHTHDPIVNTNPKTGERFINRLDKPGRPVSAEDVRNIETGRATPSEPLGR
jgi:RHS repeat-associated protein